jgi:hypothetical protein
MNVVLSIFSLPGQDGEPAARRVVRRFGGVLAGAAPNVSASFDLPDGSNVPDFLEAVRAVLMRRGASANLCVERIAGKRRA